MRVLVTGHNGYIGSVLVPMLQTSGHDVVGLDTYLFEGCTLGPPPPDPPSLRMDIRDVERAHLDGFDAVIHLAALSNDPLGYLNPTYTYDINFGGSVVLAQAAKQAGVTRFVFSSSCSLYGAQANSLPVTERAEFAPVTPYGHSKAKAEIALARLADEEFSPTYLRNATAYGWSAQLRGDLVVNDLVAHGYMTGEVLIKSDGTPWRPVVHVRDICRAFVTVLEAPRGLVHDEAFNVGGNDENYQISELAEIVAAELSGSSVVYSSSGEPDIRSYRVDFSKIANALAFSPAESLSDGVAELHQAYLRHGLTERKFERKFQRIRHLEALLAKQVVGPDLRWTSSQRLSSQVGK